METIKWIIVSAEVFGQAHPRNRLVEHPADSRSIRVSPLHSEADDSTGELVHHHHYPMRFKPDGFAAEEIYAPEAIFRMPNYSQPRRTVSPLARTRSVMLGQNSTDDVLVDLDAEGFGDLLRNPWAAKPRISSLHLDNGLDNGLGWSLGPGFSLHLRRKQPAVFSFLERFMKLEQGRRTDDDCDPVNSSGLDKDGPEAQQKPIPSCQIGCSFTRTIGDDKLVPHRQILSDEAPSVSLLN